jgi:gliding motility-associated-like protein
MLKHYSFFCFFFFLCAYVQGQDVWLHPNEGQWDERIEYKLDIDFGEILIEKDKFTYHLNDSKITDHQHSEEEHTSDSVKFHTITSTFLGSNWNNSKSEENLSSFYRNYILGNDQSKWRSKVYSYSNVRMHELYSGVELRLNTESGGLNYSFEIRPGVNPGIIQRKFDGQDKIEIDEDGNLRVLNRFGEINESAPMAWNLIDGKRKMVRVNFKIEDNIVSFDFPRGYDQNQVLIIDPNITFSSFTGSTADNWGMSATPDANGNLFAGGVAFSAGYPTSVGVYDATFNGGTVDVTIFKFTADGSGMMYSTYLGGIGSETPNSMICAPNGELFIYGMTSSNNFPMAGTPYNSTFSGGPNVSVDANGLGFTQGSDLYVARLSADGSTLIASTYMGGTSTDGLNISSLKYNYGDQFRGEIVLDDVGNVYVASSTRSSDFPTVNAIQTVLNGPQDAVAFKMPSTLNTLSWSTYFGGNGSETGNSIQLSSTGEVYFVGGTTSMNLVFNSGASLAYNGGIADGYAVRLNGTTGAMLSGTYIGMSEYDQVYCVQLDIDDNVYVLGQTESNWPITAGHYGVANSGQFIRKYNNSMTSVLWTTMVGAGTGHVEISPTAFLVSDCYDIYFSGWGGQLNVQDGQALWSTTNGFPVTPDAFQPTTSGSNFYISVLGQDAMTLKYGTFMGGVTSPYNHVDGGTSRFDKQGRIYHAVCASCGAATTGFTTTPGVWSATDNGPNCNLAAFKFELSTIEAIIAVPQTVVCIPDPVVFSNNSANGNSFFWDFGDNTSSTAENPSHLYTAPGTYEVTLVVSDINGCFTPDSVVFEVVIGDFEGGVIEPSAAICPGEPFEFEAYGGSIYEWSPGIYLDDSTSATPTAIVLETTDFMVIISDTCGIDTVYVTLPVFLGASNISNDTSICLGNSIQLNAEGGVSYEWTPATFLDDPFSSTPIATPDATITYNVEITTASGCVLNEDVLITVYFELPAPILADTVIMCDGSPVTIVATGTAIQTYNWYPTTFISPLNSAAVTVNPPNDTWYYCDFGNACGTATDSVFIDVKFPNINAGNDTIICPNETARLWSSGASSYSWTPSSFQFITTDTILAFPNSPTVYYVIGTDEFGCIGQDSVIVEFYPTPEVDAGLNVYAFYGDEVQLNATSLQSGLFVWTPSESLTCGNCPSPIAEPNRETVYTVTITDQNGCQSSDIMTIFYDITLYVPNTFTPDQDEFNQTFRAFGGNVNEFHMTIFDRWGEVIFETYNMQYGWDGTYNGLKCQDGTYIWKIELEDAFDKKDQLVGHVNLIR